ncbi:MAG: hypothetical protein HKN76_10145 [Saprospiraceae bacterium]|nr:hypothetical protein [Saprospiraceae bacterium]
MRRQYVFLQFLLFFSFQLVAQSAIIDSLQKALPKAESSSEKFKILNKLCQHTTSVNRDLAMKYALIYDSLAHDINDPYQLARAKVLIGSVDFTSGEYEKAAEAFLSAVSDFSAINDSSQVGAMHNNLSAIAWAQKDTMGAINYLLEAIPYYTGSTRLRRLIINHTNLGGLLRVAGRYDEAKKYLLRAIDYVNELKTPQELGGPYSSLTQIALEQGDVRQAKVYATLALHHLSATKDIQTIQSVWRVKAKIASKENDFPEMKRCLDLAQEITDGNNLKTMEAGLLSDWKEYFVKIGDYRNAFHYSEKLRLKNDSTLNLERDRNLTELREKFEMDKKEKEIALLSVQNDLNETKILASRRQNTGLLFGLVILGLFSIILWRLFSKIKTQNLLISYALQEKDTLLREIHHRVKNNLQVISSLLSLQSKYIHDENAIDALKQGQSRVRSMALIHQDLYQSDNLKGVNAQIYFSKLLDNLLHSYKIKDGDITMDVRVDPIILDVDTMIPLGLVINELISNALKHAFSSASDPTIKVRLQEVDELLVLEISDNGSGVADINEMQNKSFGFSLVKIFASKLKADLAMKSEAGFSVEMKIKQFEKAA